VFAVSMPVFAHEGESGDDSSSTTTTTTTTEQENHTTSSGSTTVKEDRQKLREDRKQQVQQKVAEKKTEHQQKVCENRKKGLTVRSARIVANSKRIDEKITDIYKKVDNYKTTNNLTVDNYDALTSAVTTAQTNAATAISDLEKVVPSTDCTSTTNTNSTDAAAFKTAAKNTRDSLKAYRTAVKNLLVAVMKAKDDTTTNTSTGGAE
jgi:3-methyladenine DNA glycosylase/8-oxoguanine DNA glycosylase